MSEMTIESSRTRMPNAHIAARIGGSSRITSTVMRGSLGEVSSTRRMRFPASPSVIIASPMSANNPACRKS